MNNVNKLYATIGGLLSVIVLMCVLGAAPPSPIQHNQWTTNVQGQPIQGNIIISNGVPLTGTNFLYVDGTGISELINGGIGWALESSGTASFIWGPLSSSSLNTNGQIQTSVKDPAIPAAKFFGATGQGANYAEIHDGAGNTIAYCRSNAFWGTTNDFFAAFQSTDNTTNVILTITLRDNAVARVFMDTSGWNSVSSASYGRIGTFKSVAGTVTLVGAVAALGNAEDDGAYECLLDTSANVVRVRVAGNTGRTVNWKTYVRVYYSE